MVGDELLKSSRFKRTSLSTCRGHVEGKPNVGSLGTRTCPLHLRNAFSPQAQARPLGFHTTFLLVGVPPPVPSMCPDQLESAALHVSKGHFTKLRWDYP